MSGGGSRFQSTPVIANGRIIADGLPPPRLRGFNPRPLLLTGESPLHRCLSGHPLSFNPRPLLLTGESMLMSSRVASSSCFNPRPLLLTGESELSTTEKVSTASFQSTPVIANGRIGGKFRILERYQWFQSTPVIANGRIGKSASFDLTTTRFNPRPLLLTGESPIRLRDVGEGRVSIHARYC